MAERMADDIKVHSSMQAVVEDGTKTITVRKGKRNYFPGDFVRVGCDSYGWYLGMIESVEQMPLGDVPQSAREDDGFQSHEEMVETLREFYPDIDRSSDVTVIRWMYV
jgi:hypothetical protein